MSRLRARTWTGRKRRLTHNRRVLADVIRRYEIRNLVGFVPSDFNPNIYVRREG